MNEDLLKRIDKLEQEMELLKSSSNIPRPVEVAFQERLGTPIGTGSAGATTTISAFSFNMPANPSGTLTVKYRGKLYNLLYK